MSLDQIKPFSFLKNNNNNKNHHHGSDKAIQAGRALFIIELLFFFLNI